ncbi:DUF5995 family protein [Streptomyces cavernicola]|uniref:DUF5995 family protein n=1 Tax=Streptomyces cavernicola TaxID=3043613 RepID=A0ABT6SFH2_9ACTN|nr:DUF5995 family protein [Streptomyces sp. B-S-A6]MDI3406594.1 DUF5995 family protein [Streptomyces sp. B-S-A6]
MALTGQIGTVTVEARPGAAGADRVLAQTRAPDADRPHPDGAAVFHRAYLAVAGEPAAPTASALETRLAERYFAARETVRGGHRPPAAWRPLFQFRRHPGVRPLQFGLAGINAHVGHDLPLAVVDACLALGCEPAAVEGEFERVGDRLLALEERIVEDLAPGPDLLHVTDPLAHLLGVWSLERARDTAWSAARVLWSLRELPDLAAEFSRRTDAGVGLVGRCLLTPWR